MLHLSLINVATPIVLAWQDSGASDGGGSGGEEGAIAAILAGALGLMCCAFAVVLAIWAVVCWLVSDAQRKVPQNLRLMGPGAVWLLMIPLFNIIWAFFVFSKVPQSLQAATKARGITDAGDCGQRWGLVFSILYACTLVSGFIPFLGPLVAIGALVFLVMTIVAIRSAAARLAVQ